MTERRPTTTRAVSTTLGYTLTLAISTLLVTGLIIAGGNFVSTQRDIVIENELEVVGEQVASQLEQADRLVTASNLKNPQVSIQRSIPDQIVGETYDIHLEKGGGGTDTLRLETDNPDIAVSVDMSLEKSKETSATGGTLVARWESGSGLVIENA